MPADHYANLGVERRADSAALRAAYRRRARELHPDLVGLNESAPETNDLAQEIAANRRMADLNEAWRTLSDPRLRSEYDKTLAAPIIHDAPRSESTGDRWTDPARRPSPGPGSGQTSTGVPFRQPGWRREAWLGGIRVQIRRLGNQAGRSATQTLLLKSRLHSRADYEQEIEPIVEHLSRDTGERVRQARAAGATPLDLGIVSALIGLRSAAAEIDQVARRGALTPGLRRRAAMIDRMWDTMAHELPRDIVVAVGDNPHVSRGLG